MKSKRIPKSQNLEQDQTNKPTADGQLGKEGGEVGKNRCNIHLSFILYSHTHFVIKVHITAVISIGRKDSVSLRVRHTFGMKEQSGKTW